MIEYFYAFLLGMLSILSPCTFILIPVMLSKVNDRIKDIILFLSGVIVTFVILGIITAVTGILLTSFIGNYIYLVSAVITLVLSLHILGIFRFNIPSLSGMETKNNFIIGLLYGGVVLSCIGPLIGAVLAYIVAKAEIAYGISMMLVFSLGFVTPFLIFGGIITDKSVRQKIMQHSGFIQKISGLLMLFASLYLFWYGFGGFQ